MLLVSVLLVKTKMLYETKSISMIDTLHVKIGLLCYINIWLAAIAILVYMGYFIGFS